ncbi:MAG: type II toxin-antitoxin system RelE/ParE family toxin [Blastocatellia bacterium]
MNVVRREKALEDLADCAFYIADDDPAVADRFVDAFELSVERLAQMPYLGVAHSNDNPALFGLRRWPIKGFEKYLIFYLVLEDVIDIVRILHVAQDIAAILEGE